MEKEVNPHFRKFLFDWDQKFQFLVGGYGSSKSYHIALKLILKLLDEKRTALVIREVYDTHRDSTFSLFEEIVNDLGLDHVIQCRTSPLMLKFHNNKDYIPKSNKNRPGNYMKPLYITVHNTANIKKGADAANHASFVKRSSTGVSWHYTVDENYIYQHLPLNENGWHAGDGRGTGNMKSIGIEICENADGNFEKALENAQWLIRQLMTEQGIPLANVVPHKRWSGKECPRKLLNRWNSFKAGIATAHTGKKETAKPPKATPVKNTPSKPKASKPKKSFNLPSGIIKVTKPLTKGAGVKALQEALAAVYFYPDKGEKITVLTDTMVQRQQMRSNDSR